MPHSLAEMLAGISCIEMNASANGGAVGIPARQTGETPVSPPTIL